MDAARDTRGGIPADPDPADVRDGGAAPSDGEGVTTEVTAGRHAGKGAGKAEAPAEPYAYVALTDLYLGGDGESGSVPVCAHRAGALVLPHDVARYGWADLVRRADEPAPDDKE